MFNFFSSSLHIKPLQISNHPPRMTHITISHIQTDSGGRAFCEGNRTRTMPRIVQSTENGFGDQLFNKKQAAGATQLTYTLWRVDGTFSSDFDRAGSGERDAIRPPILRRNPVPPTRISPNQKALTWCVKFWPHRLRVFDNGLTLFRCGASTFDGTRRRS